MKLVKLADLKASPHNARHTFDEVKMKELVASVEEKGILNPILVRPIGKSAYEIVCGERRFRAAKAAGLEEIPAVVRPLTDQQALECQVIENLQREDVHPLEEAEGYEALMKKHGYKVVTPKSEEDIVNDAPMDGDLEELYKLGEEKVKRMIARAVLLKPERNIEDDQLEFLSTKLGFSMAKDYVITKEYLGACTKEQLVKLGQELKIPNILRVPGGKKELVEFVLKNAPKGKVPKELVKWETPVLSVAVLKNMRA